MINDYTASNIPIRRRIMRRSKRGPLMIIISILSALEESDMNKTSLSYRTNLDIRVLNRYLEYLCERGLVSCSNSKFMRVRDPTLVGITDRGREALFHFREAIRLIDRECDLRDRCSLRRLQ